MNHQTSYGDKRRGDINPLPADRISRILVERIHPVNDRTNRESGWKHPNSAGTERWCVVDTALELRRFVQSELLSQPIQINSAIAGWIMAEGVTDAIRGLWLKFEAGKATQ